MPICRSERWSFSPRSILLAALILRVVAANIYQARTACRARFHLFCPAPTALGGSSTIVIIPILQKKVWRLREAEQPVRVHMAWQIRRRDQAAWLRGPSATHHLALLRLLTAWCHARAKCVCVIRICLFQWILGNLRPRDCSLAISVGLVPTRALARVNRC